MLTHHPPHQPCPRIHMLKSNFQCEYLEMELSGHDQVMRAELEFWRGRKKKKNNFTLLGSSDKSKN